MILVNVVLSNIMNVQKEGAVIVAPQPPPPQVLKSGGFTSLTTSQVLRSVYVTNISSKATLKDVSDFFSYCGNVEKVIQTKDPYNQTSQIAVIVMDHEHAYATALILSNVIIVDSPIQMYPYRDLVDITAASQKHAENYAEKEKRSAIKVVKVLIDCGHITDQKTIGIISKRAQQLEETSTIQQRINLALKFATGKNRTDNDQQIQETLNTVKETATSLGTKVMESEAMRQTSDFFSRSWDFIKTSFNEATAPSPDTVTRATPQQEKKKPPSMPPPIPQHLQKKDTKLLEFD